MYFDSLPMLTLFRGGPTVWMNKEDAEEAGVADNDWIECFNRNGVVVARSCNAPYTEKEWRLCTMRKIATLTYLERN